MSQSFLERLAGRFRGREKKTAATYLGLIVQLADGGEPDLASAEGVLRDAGKTTENLAAAVERFKARRAAAAAMKRGEAARKELESVESRAASADAAFRAAVAELERKHSAAMAELRLRASELQGAIDAARRGEALLRDTADEPAGMPQLRQRLVEARRERDQILRQANEARKAADAAMITATGSYGYSDSYKNDNRQAAATKQAAHEQFVKDAEGPAEEVRRLEAEIAALEETALTP